MLRFLIIDDNCVRVEELREALLAATISEESIDCCSSAMAGRKLLRTTRYDFLVLDICLPRRDGDRPSREEGLNLLIDVNENPKYIMPEEIIGITEYDEIFADVINEFRRRMTHVIKYSESSVLWKEQLVLKVSQRLNFKKYRDNKKQAVLTVHGIRTYGNWQKLLEDTILEQGINAEVISFKYNFLPIFSYFSLFLRNRLAKRFSKDLHILLQNDQYDTIDIIGHSFGTHLITYALNNIELLDKKKIRNVIFSGSVVPESFNWTEIIGPKIDRLINDCAFDDFILVINKCFIPFGGMSGRVGFKGFDAGLINRYFKGGHDTFYMRNKEIDNYFIKKYWIPVLTGPNHIMKYDQRGKPSIFEDFYFIVNIICFVKHLLCFLLPIIVLYYLFELIRGAEVPWW